MNGIPIYYSFSFYIYFGAIALEMLMGGCDVLDNWYLRKLNAGFPWSIYMFMMGNGSQDIVAISQ